MSSAYFAPIQWYQKLNRYDFIYIEANDNFTKQTYRNRCVISTTNGIQVLTVPVEHDKTSLLYPSDKGGKNLMKDIRISNHGNWRHLHWGALYSAYGKSPYFDYIAPDLHDIIHGNQSSLLDFNTQLQALIIDFLDLPIEIITTDITPEITAEAIDLRGKIGGKKPDALAINTVPYHQVWAARHGFLPNLSILDLLMNTGRECIYTLLKSII